MLDVRDIANTLCLILGLGLILAVWSGRAKVNSFGRLSSVEGFDDAIPCGVNNPCEVGLKCINGFCAKTERLRTYEKDADNQAESSGPMSLY
jgi:hypothetical protein